MKKLFSFFIVLSLLLSTKMFAQTAASAVWDLGDSTGAAVTGNIAADTMGLAGTLEIKDFSGGALSGPAVRVSAGTVGWAANEAGPDFTRYIQFLVKPTNGNSMHVDSIAFWLACYGTHGNMHAAVYWDKDTVNFSQNNLLDYDSVTFGDIKGLPDVRDGAAGMPHDTSFAINTDVQAGGLFAFRVYPWYNASSASTSKYVVMWLVRVYGTTSPATAVKNEPQMPKQFALDQNYPNPFNPSTNISFELPKSGHVMLNVFNLLGQKVATLIDQNMQAGSHSVHFDATNLPSGLYFYQLQSGNFNSVKKMVLMK